jgi:hypothetical protein
MSRATLAEQPRPGDKASMEDTALIECATEFMNESLEEHRVLQWRLEQFARLGFRQPQVTTMALSTVDLASARKIVAAGCPLETAARILL